MKIMNLFVAVLVLTAMLLTGCGCRNSKPLDTMPSENTTVPTTVPTTQATTEPTTVPTTVPTTTATESATDNGNGGLPAESGITENPENTVAGRSVPRVK